MLPCRRTSSPLTPYKLHFSEPSAYYEIYSAKNRWNKEPSLYQCFGEDRSSFGFLTYHEAKERKDVLAPLFSTRAVQNMQHLIQEKVTPLPDLDIKPPNAFAPALSSHCCPRLPLPLLNPCKPRSRFPRLYDRCHYLLLLLSLRLRPICASLRFSYPARHGCLHGWPGLYAQLPAAAKTHLRKPAMDPESIESADCRYGTATSYPR